MNTSLQNRNKYRDQLVDFELANHSRVRCNRLVVNNKKINKSEK